MIPLLGDGLGQRRRLGGVGHIGLDGHRLARQVGSRLFSRVSVHVRDDDRRTVLGEDGRDSCAGC